jgi:lipopolysaccharide/colanic/teichoic acid biosynthesis glycosyltransferase
MIMSSEKIHMFDTPLLLFRNCGLTVEQQVIKRIFDIICSVLMFIVLSPLFLLIAILIKCYDGGPVLYKQERLTKDGKIFMVYKFRSMRVDSEQHGARLAMKGDSRVTPVGKVLRNIHFDELPQLFNIIKGDMSLVGPRPERPEIAAQYTKEIPEFSYRLKVKAGLTGYAQVYGKYNTTPYDKLKLDMTYIENYSFVLDLQLIATTIKILFQKENTEGVEQWQTTAATGGKKAGTEANLTNGEEAAGTDAKLADEKKADRAGAKLADGEKADRAEAKTVAEEKEDRTAAHAGKQTGASDHGKNASVKKSQKSGQNNKKRKHHGK